MGSETNTVTIYEIGGAKYTGTQKIEIKSHVRFLSFVTLRVDNQEYSIGSDDLMRAIGRAIGHRPATEEGMLLKGTADIINQFAEQASGKREETKELPSR